MMKYALYGLLALLALSLSFVKSAIGAETCSESGKIKTTTLNDTTQRGTIIMNTDAGTPDLEGSVTGRIKKQPSASEPFINFLDHTLVFPGEGTIHTRKDKAVITEQTNECTFEVVEDINIVKGTGTFANITGSVTANGTVNRCSGENSFTYQGKICWVSRE